MSLRDMLIDDWSLIDGIEYVTLTQPGSTPITTIPALRRVLTKQEMASLGQAIIEADDLPFHLWTDEVEPAQGDKITDSEDVSYTIISSQKMTMGTRWRCVCRKQR